MDQSTGNKNDENSDDSSISDVEGLTHEEWLKQNSKTCEVCNESFSTMKALNKHLALHARAEKKNNDNCMLPFLCHLCKRKFTSHMKLANHLKSVHAKQPVCDYCGKKCRHRHELEKHVRTHTGEKPFHCQFCPRSFSTKCNCQRHMTTVHSIDKKNLVNLPAKGPLLKTEQSIDKKNLVNLPENSPQLQTEQSIDKKNLVNLPEKGLQELTEVPVPEIPSKKKRVMVPDEARCNICEKVYSNLSNLKRHHRTHVDKTLGIVKQPSHCLICNATFESRQALLDHNSRLHFSKVCGVCQMLCVTEDELKLHAATHNSTKPYKCQYCNRRFIRVGNRNRHQDMMHIDKQFY